MPLFPPHRSRAKCDDRLIPACCVRCVHNGIFTHFEQLSTTFTQPKKKPAERVSKGICGLLEGEPTTRLELVTYRLRIKNHSLIINDLQGCCVLVAFDGGRDRKKFILSRREEGRRYSKEFVSGFHVTASMFRPAGVAGLLAALVVFGVASALLALERSLISAWTLVVNPDGLRE